MHTALGSWIRRRSESSKEPYLLKQTSLYHALPEIQHICHHSFMTAMNLVLWKSLPPLSSKHNEACPPLKRGVCCQLCLLWSCANTARASIDLSQLVCCARHNRGVYKYIYYRANIHMHVSHINPLLLLMSSTAHRLFISAWYSRVSRPVQSLNFYLRLNYPELTDDSRVDFCGKTCWHMEYSCSPGSFIRLCEWTQIHRVILAQWVSWAFHELMPNTSSMFQRDTIFKIWVEYFQLTNEWMIRYYMCSHTHEINIAKEQILLINIAY